MKKIVLCILLIICFFYENVYSAECEIVMDQDSGRVLYGKNIDEERLIASTTKIMTALVVLNNADVNDVVTVGDEIIGSYGSSIYLKVGEKLTVLDLLYGLMLRSGNDAALVLANYVGSSAEGFVLLMNETAISIGMKNTVFSNPHGLDEESQNTSTVYDMALLMREAMKNSVFREITSSKSYSLKTNFGNYEWYNKNELLTMYKYATGGKIGYTTSARHTFVSSASKDNKNLIVATFVDGDRFNTHMALYEKYFEDYDKYTLIDKNNLNIEYKTGYKVYTTESFTMLLTKDEAKEVKRTVVIFDDVNIQKNGTMIGYVSISLNGTTYKKLSLFADALEKENFWDKLRKWFNW